MCVSSGSRQKRHLGHRRSVSLSLSAGAVAFTLPREGSGAVSCRAVAVYRADDVVEHEGGFCRRTHVTSDSFSTPASRRRAFIPTRRATPPFASLDQHPAWPDWSARRGARVGDGPATRGFYGNGGGVARDNLVIGIAAAGTGCGGFGCARGDGGGRTRGGRTEDGGSSRMVERRRRARNKRSPAGLPPTVPREITRRTPP